MDTKPLALIIEDNDDQNIVFTTALERAGYQAESFLDGSLAQERLASVIPEMVILDLHIPGVNGNTILRNIRSDHRFRNTRVILVTADAALASALQPQADLVLLKPISFTQLMQLSERYLSRPKRL
ncbi:MAG: response regulator [Chloroflexota bacterium]